MRTLLKITVDTKSGNTALADGSLPAIIKSTIERLNPEAAYFLPLDGNRSCFMVFDLQDPSEIPSIAEPLFTTLNAKVEFSPVMNVEELQKGLQSLRKPEFALEQ